MRVVDCAPELENRWDSYVANASEGCFYHLYGWRRINDAVFGHRTFCLAAMKGDGIIGVLPVVYMKSRLFGKVMCSMPFVNYGGICADSEEAESGLLEAAEDLVSRTGAKYLEFRGARKYRRDLPTSKKKVSMTARLESDPETIWQTYRTKHRTNIRRAYKNGFSTRSGGLDLLDEFYDVLSESWRNLGTPIYRKKYFQRILEEFPDKTALFVVSGAGEPLAAAFNGYYRNIVEGMWAGTRGDGRRMQATYVLYWDMVKDACRRGCRLYHFGRSTANSGGEQFKNKWNMERRQLYWQYALPASAEMPELNVDNPRFQVAIRAWRRMPVGLTRLLGPLVAGSIP